MDEEPIRDVGVADGARVLNDTGDLLRLAKELKDLVNLQR